MSPNNQQTLWKNLQSCILQKKISELRVYWEMHGAEQDKESSGLRRVLNNKVVIRGDGKDVIKLL